MSGILRALSDSTFSEIEIAECGGLRCRVRKVRSADLAGVGLAALNILPAAARTDAENGQPFDPADAIARLDPKKATELLRHQEGMVCASLVAVFDPEAKQWEPIQLVMDAKREDVNAGRLWVGALPPAVQSAVFEEAMRLSTDEVAASASEGFRGKAGSVASAG